LTVAGGVGISGQVWSSAEITSMKTLNSLPGDAALAAQIGGTTSAPRIKMWGELGAGIGGKILFNTGNGGMIDCGSGGSIRIASNGSIMTIIDSSGNLSVTTKGYQPGGGSWAASSDARIKNELGEYTRGLADVTALRPVYYTYKGNDTAAEPAAGKDAEGNALPVAVPYANSPHGVVAASATKYAGLIAQEVEGIFPEMVTKTAGYIDGAAVSDLRTLDTTPLIFALINAVKELKARVEELEAA
jgi:hypothetical protein